MKRMIIIIALLPLLSFGQSEKLSKAILKGKLMIANADTVTQYIAAANYFERIKLNENAEWLPAYYQALSLTFASSNLPVDEKETYLNQSLAIVKEANKITQNSELVALEGFIQMMRLTIDPGTRGQSLSPTIYALFNKSLAIDSNNPRAMLFLGQMEYGTSQFFGSGTDKACGYIQKAKELFDSQTQDLTIYPSWGNDSLDNYLNRCK